MADKQAAEKQAILRAFGAEVVLCPTNVPPESPESYYSVAARLARDIPGAYLARTSTGTRRTRRPMRRRPGPEIWAQTDGRITHLVACVGTGGTITGAARYLRAKRPDLVVVGADPEGSVLSGDTARPYLHGGRRRGLLPGAPSTPAGRSLGARLGPRRVRDGSADHARGGDPGRGIVRDRDGGRPGGRARPDRRARGRTR